MTQTIDMASREGTKLAGKYLTFQLGEEHYGLPILRVREIIGLMNVTRVPRTPDYIRGVINLRGRIIPVLELRQRFEMPVVEDTNESCIIVIETGEGAQVSLMGVLVDRVREVLDIAAEEIEPTPSFGDGGGAGFIQGMAKGEDRVTVLLDTEKTVNVPSGAIPDETTESI